MSQSGSAPGAALGSAPVPQTAPARSGGVWRMLLAMALSGTIGLFVMESGLPPLLVVFGRCVLGGIGLAAWLGLRRQWVQLDRSDWLWLIVGGVALVLNWIALFTAYRYSSIAIATVVYHFQPFILLGLAALQGEPIERRKLPWLVLALVGVVLSSGLIQVGDTDKVNHAVAWQGVVLALVAASLYSLTTVATRRLVHVPSAQIAMLQMVAGGAALAFWALPLALHLWEQSPQTMSARAAVCVAILGVVHTAFMYTVMYAAFQRLSAPAIAALSFVYPAVALLIDLLWFGAVPSPVQWLGMACIVVAVLVHRLRK